MMLYGFSGFPLDAPVFCYTNDMSDIRYSREQAENILARFSSLGQPELREAFFRGTIFDYEEAEGQTKGAFVAWNVQNPGWIKLVVAFFFQSRYGRWTGKVFLRPFSANGKGFGINVFDSRLRPRRYRFDTYQKPAYQDGKPCIALDYRAYFSIMFGLFDDLRKVEPGVFLGQMWYKFPWSQRPMLLGYFVLCAL